MTNPSPAPVEVVLDLYTERGPDPAVLTIEVPAESPARVPLVGRVEILAARISSNAPVAAAVVGVGDAGTAITPGIATAARDWLVPGLRSLGLDVGTLWILNSSEEPTTVTVSSLVGGDLVGERITIEPASQARVIVADSDAVGYYVQAADPITVAWSITGPAGTALSVGTPVTGD